MGRSAEVPRAADVLGSDDTGCSILHVDMDAFFASVEIRRRPELRGKPVAVGGHQRGVVAAASYEARRYGVRSAMPMTQARRLCPSLIVVPPDGAAYRAASATVMGILRDVTPRVQPMSLDEAFLDVGGALRLHGRPVRIAAGIRARVFAELGLTCSVGVAPSKFVAKLASTRCKPDGLLLVPVDSVLAFLWPLPVTVIGGVGPKTADALHRLGITTVAELAATPTDALRRAVGEAGAAHLHELANGRDPRTVHTGEREKSISSDRTMEADLLDSEAVHRELLRLSGEVGRRVRAAGLQARTVGIKIRFADFKTITRVRTLPAATDSTSAIYRTARELYAALGLDRPRIRLVGVRCAGLQGADTVPEQLTLDVVESAEAERTDGRTRDPADSRRRHSADSGKRHSADSGKRHSADSGKRHRAAESVLDAARARYGSSALAYGTLLGSPERPDTTRTKPGPDTEPA